MEKKALGIKMYIRPKVVLTCSSKNVMSRTTAAIDIPPIFTVIDGHSPRPTRFLHQPSRWVKRSLDRNDRMDIFQIFDGGTNFWNFFRDVELPLVCYFDGGEIVVQGLPFGPATPKALIPWVRKSAGRFCQLIYRHRVGLWSHWIHMGLEQIESLELGTQCKDRTSESL